MAKCQRYQLVLHQTKYSPMGTFQTFTDAGVTRFFIPTPVSMRTDPTIILTGKVRLEYTKDGVGGLNMRYSDLGTSCEAGMGCLAPLVTIPDFNITTFGRIDSNTSFGKVIFDANL